MSKFDTTSNSGSVKCTSFKQSNFEFLNYMLVCVSFFVSHSDKFLLTKLFKC